MTFWLKHLLEDYVCTMSEILLFDNRQAELAEVVTSNEDGRCTILVRSGAACF
jgi:hypothetical protein